MRADAASDQDPHHCFLLCTLRVRSELGLIMLRYVSVFVLLVILSIVSAAPSSFLVRFYASDGCTGSPQSSWTIKCGQCQDAYSGNCPQGASRLLNCTATSAVIQGWTRGCCSGTPTSTYTITKDQCLDYDGVTYSAKMFSSAAGYVSMSGFIPLLLVGVTLLFV